MKKIVSIILLLLLSINILAQKEYTGKTLGWMKMFNPNEIQKPFTIDHHQYSAKQMQISQIVASWIQQSYQPKSSIGRAWLMVNEKLGQYNQHTKAQPQYYGATSKTFLELKKNAAGQWEPYTNTNWFMQIAINGVIGDRSYAITTPEKWFFYIPGDKGLEEDEKRVANLNGFSTNPTLKKYISWYQPKGIGTTLQYVVLLCKDNVKPYVQVTKGEYLEELGSAIERDGEEKIRNGVPSASVNDLLNQRRTALNRLKEKYRNRLTEPAKLKEQPDLNLESSSGAEIFENRNYPSEFPVYKFVPTKLALTKTDQPQWIIISWTAEGVANGDEAGIHLHKSMLNNIDFDYIYNFFFYPEKVKGIPYRPRQ